MNLALTRPPLPWVASGSLLALLAFLVVAVLHPLLLLAAGAAAVLGMALALTGPWRRFHATAPVRTAFIGC